MKTSRMILLLVAVFAVAHPRSAQAEELLDFAQLYPPHTVLYVTADNLAGSKTDANNPTAWESILAEPSVKEFLRGSRSRIAALVKKFESKTPFRLAELKAVFGRRVALGVLFNPLKNERGIVIIGEADSVAAARKFRDRLAVLVTALIPGGTDALTIKKEQDKIFLSVNGVTLTLAVKNKRLYIIADKDGKTYDQLLAMPAMKSLATTPVYRNNEKRLSPKRSCLAFLNLQSVWPLLNMLAVGNPKQKKTWDFLSKLGATKVQSASYSLARAGKGYRGRLFLNIPEPRQGVSGLIGKQPVPQELLATVPADARMVVAKMYKNSRLLDALRSLLGKEKGQLDEKLKELKTQFGLDLETDIFANLGDGSIFTIQNSARLGGIPFLGLNSFTLIVETTNPTLLRENLLRLFSTSGKLIKQTPIVGGTFTETHNATKITGLRIANVIAPSFAVTDKYLIFASSPDAVSSILDTLAGKRANITTNKDYQKLAKQLRFADASSFAFAPSMRGSGSISLAMIGVGVGITFLEDYLATTFPVGKSPKYKAFQRKLDRHPEQVVMNILRNVQLYKLPSGDTISQYLFASGTCVHTIPEGFLYEGYGPLPFGQGFGAVSGGGSSGSLKTVAVISVMAGLLLPALEKAKGAAQKVACMSNLRQLGIGRAMYETKYGDSAKTLKDLYQNGHGMVKDAKVFRCPKTRQGYMYAENLPIKAEGLAKQIVAWDATSIHEFRRKIGRNVLYADGIIKFLDNEEFKHALENLRAWAKNKNIPLRIRASEVRANIAF